VKKTYVFRKAWLYHFDPLFDWISALPICSSAKILLARLHNSNRTLERVKRGEAGPFTFPWELQEIAQTFRRANSAVTKWRAELEACGAASYGSGSWTLPVPEFFRETRFTHFTKVKSDFTLVKCPSLLEQGEEYKEGTNTYSRACVRDNRLLGDKKLRVKAHAVKRRLARLHWDNCKVRFDPGSGISFVASALAAGFLEADILAAYDRALPRNNRHAIDRQAVWDTRSTVSDARQWLAKTSRRFDPGQSDPEIARQVRESLLSVSAPARTERSRPDSQSGRSVMMHRPVFAVTPPILTVRLRQHRLAPDADGTVPDRPTDECDYLACHHCREPSLRLPAPFKSGSVAASSALPRSCRTCSKIPFRTFGDPTALLTFARLFLGQRRDGIALSLGEVPCGSLPLFSRFSLRVSGPLREASSAARLNSPRISPKFILTLKTTMAHQSKPGTTQFALDLPLEAKLRFETLHASMGFKTKAQTFQALLYFVSTKDKTDPAMLQRMENKIDHSIHLLESLT
jgi:hypothetical protein